MDVFICAHICDQCNVLCVIPLNEKMSMLQRDRVSDFLAPFAKSSSSSLTVAELIYVPTHGTAVCKVPVGECNGFWAARWSGFQCQLLTKLSRRSSPQ